MSSPSSVSTSEKDQYLRWPLAPPKKEMDVELSTLLHPTPPTTSSSSSPQLAANNRARDSVLATPELLEGILKHIPLKELLTTVQLVSSMFHDTIYDSVAIQQALFFLPDTSPHASFPCPLLHACGPSSFIDERSSSFAQNGKSGHFPWPGPSENGLRPLMWQEYTRKFKAYATKGASWRRMLVVQPPVKELRLNGGNVLRNSVGVTMGQLENSFMEWGRFVIGKDGKATLQSRGNLGLYDFSRCSCFVK